MCRNMHLKKCKLWVWHPITVDPFEVTPKVTGSSKYPMRMGLVHAHVISQVEISNIYKIHNIVWMITCRGSLMLRSIQ